MEAKEWIDGAGGGEFFSWILERENNATCIFVHVKINLSSGQC